ncbi:hypothetical protein PZA11_003446 [Diplocarpon coronariae]
MLSTLAIVTLAAAGSMAAYPQAIPTAKPPGYRPNSTVAVANSANAAFNCVGMTVGNVEEAIKFYTEGLDFHLLSGPTLMNRSQEVNAAVFTVYSHTNVMNVAWLGAANNGIGLELFQYIDPPYVAPKVASISPFQKHWKIGLTSTNTTALSLKAVAAGGRVVGEPIPTAGSPTLHVLDPWDNLVEILPKPYEVFFEGLQK